MIKFSRMVVRGSYDVCLAKIFRRMLTSKVVPVWEFPKMTSREFPGISRFFGKTRAGNGKKHIEIFGPKLQRHF